MQVELIRFQYVIVQPSNAWANYRPIDQFPTITIKCIDGDDNNMATRTSAMFMKNNNWNVVQSVM